jgi:protein-disulfide isomerase
VEDLKGLILSVEGVSGIGSTAAQVGLLEFSDFECPFCNQYATHTFHRIRTEFVEPGLVRYLWANYPLANIHRFAYRAAEAAVCAGEQGKHLEMRAQLFANASRLSEDNLYTYAGSIGLDATRFSACLTIGRKELIEREMHLGRTSGVSGTPTFLVGYFRNRETFEVRKRLRGAIGHEKFRALLRQVLDRLEQE